MNNTQLPLKVVTISELYNTRPERYVGEKAIYEVPIYQRNYAWERDEIYALIQDVYHAILLNKENYYIGTLVSFYKGDQVHEIIDGQQRLTTIFLILNYFGIKCNNRLTYRARKKSSNTIAFLNERVDRNDVIEDKDLGIMRGRTFAKESIESIVSRKEDQKAFSDYFQDHVQIVHYHVPKDIDLNHYFEIMNSRGEQLEMSEIIKARLMEQLVAPADKTKMNLLWECCSEMSSYVQQKYSNKVPDRDAKRIFGSQYASFVISSFDDFPSTEESINEQSIESILLHEESQEIPDESNQIDSFQPIIDFPNFLLMVLKITLFQYTSLSLKDFILDDKELLNQFDKVSSSIRIDSVFVKKFGFNLLKAKFFLDNYIVHHSCEDDTIENNPWKVQRWEKDERGNRINLSDSNIQDKIVQLLSMFEVSFSAKQRKNYLFYCLIWLFDHYTPVLPNERFIEDYCTFLSSLAEKYFWDIYMVRDNLNEINTPRPGAFDGVLLFQNSLNLIPDKSKNEGVFYEIYGDGKTVETASKGIPLFIFNYLDFRIWLKYFDQIRGKNLSKENKQRVDFFCNLGCTDFDLKSFDLFYFSRTRRSLEHYFPQANVSEDGDVPNSSQIECLGNYAMIGSEANSSGSNWDPKTKITHYWEDSSRKIKPVSIASLKFFIMMQMCKDNQSNSERKNGLEWIFDDIVNHQSNMIKILWN